MQTHVENAASALANKSEHVKQNFIESTMPANAKRNVHKRDTGLEEIRKFIAS